MDEIMLKKLGDRMGSLNIWVLLTYRQKVALCSKYDRTDLDMLLYMKFIKYYGRMDGRTNRFS